MNTDHGTVGPPFATGIASAPGSCGELAQGMLSNRRLMVTCPIDIYATAEVDLRDGDSIVCGPPEAPKAIRAVEKTLKRLGRWDVHAHLRLESSMPRLKGMASSTADIVASIAATAAALETDLPVDEQVDIALSIEPSDGLMLPGIALFDYREGRVARALGEPPDMRVLVLEFSGGVDTEAFNAVDHTPVLRAQSILFAESVNLIAEGLATGDVGRIGRGATMSSVAHQSVLPKPQLPSVLQLAKDAGAAGVNVAHSGTVIGLLFDGDTERIAWACERARSRLKGLTATHAHRLIGGGVRELSEGAEV